MFCFVFVSLFCCAIAEEGAGSNWHCFDFCRVRTCIVLISGVFELLLRHHPLHCGLHGLQLMRLRVLQSSLIK